MGIKKLCQEIKLKVPWEYFFYIPFFMQKTFVLCIDMHDILSGWTKAVVGAVNEILKNNTFWK